ncbi:histidine kinase [uncultured Aquimarina sp.]|uniref:sensor histidine kinase n=1 Tax=uncultured Aquimarina sp. TaxID=575652 RepID=UPI002623637A|nr:histidine kinase [uncultured Aquimarina sp.]
MSKNIVFIICISFLLGVHQYDTYGQHQLNRYGTKLPFKIYKTTSNTLSITDIIKSDTLFKSIDSISGKTHPKDIYWIKINLTEALYTLKTDSIWYLRSRNYDYASIFYVENLQLKEKKFGRFDKCSKNTSVLYAPGIPFAPNSLIENRFIYLKLKQVISIEPTNIFKFYYTSDITEQLKEGYYSWSDIKILIPKYLFAGVCLIVFVLTFAFFITSRKKEFLFYSLYVFWLLVYLNGDVFRTNNLIFGGFTIASHWFQQIAQVLINLCYVLFVCHYLMTKKEYPKLHSVLQIIVYILITIVVLDSSFFYFEYFVGHIQIMNIQRIVMTLFGIGGMIYLLLYAKSRLAYFIVCGSFLYMVGALALLFLKIPTYMIAGASLEITIFALGLAYKIHQEQKEKLYFQKESFINNNKALRAQVNPHFIFNSLSSIQHLILADKKESAIQYLNKFSSLMRNLLESSIETTVVLSDEIKLLKKYVELEALRFDNNFNHDIIIKDGLDPDAAEIPMLLVQPFVENAILHGLLNKKGDDKQLTISFSKGTAYIICEIEDNGIGRNASRKTQSKYKESKKSRGIEVTHKRLQLLNPLEEKNICIIDMVNRLGQPSGTKVMIKIPTDTIF